MAKPKIYIKSKPIRVLGQLGHDLRDVIIACIDFCIEHRCEVILEFNGAELEITKHTNIEETINKYHES